MDVEVIGAEIIYKLIATGLRVTKILVLQLIPQMIKHKKKKLISLPGFVLCLVMTFGLTPRNSLRWQNSTSPKVYWTKPILIFAP